MNDTPVLIRGGAVVDGTGAEPRLVDVLTRGGRVVAVDSALDVTDAQVVDAVGRLVIPGLIDLHSHADDAVFDADVQLGLLRQGVTTVVAGQDGVSYAPGDGAYAGDYFGGLLGAARAYRGGGVGALLGTYDGTVPVNVAYLVPLGTVRHEVMGDRADEPTSAELDAMRSLVGAGLSEGAVGVSTGLDYVPGLFAGTDELVALASVAGAAGKVYVTHMRGGYEAGTAVGISEVIDIATRADVRVHISHLHADTDLLLGEMARMRKAGARATFDAYPYRRGCTLLGMFALPPALVATGLDTAAQQLGDPAFVDRLLADWFPQVERRADIGPDWLDNVHYSHIPDDDLRDLEGLTLRAAGERRGEDPRRLLCRVLSVTRLHAVGVARTPRVRSDDDLARVFTSEFHTGGSDGIYTGGSPHPRGFGSFARYLGTFARVRGDYSWADAVTHLSTRPADVLGLADRGRLVPGAVADVAILDPATVADRATYRNPRRPAVGIDTVIVGGAIVLADGELTGARSGVGIRG